MDGGVRGFDLARNPGLSNNTEYGAGEFPLPTRPSARSTGQSSSKVPSMTRAQQTTEAYPDLGVLKKELEKAQRERNKANLDRDQAKLDREMHRRGQREGAEPKRGDPRNPPEECAPHQIVGRGGVHGASGIP